MNNFLLGLAVNLRNVCEEVNHTTRILLNRSVIFWKSSRNCFCVAYRVFIIVPGDYFHEVLVERDTGLGIEDGGVGIAVQISGDNIILSV
jgi:hypothetical protein